MKVQESQALGAKTDLNQIRANAAKTAYDYSVKSAMDLNQSTLDIAAGVNAKTAGDINKMASDLRATGYETKGKAEDINAASSIIGSVGSVADKWSKAQTAGVFG